jgi:circadian clock protein KaiB
MARDTKNPLEDNDQELYRFCIYIVRTAPNSVRALANLRALCQKHLADRHVIEVVDILDDPLRVLNDKVLLTPTVIKLTPPPEIRIVGNLNDQGYVLMVLGIDQDKDD